MKLFGQRALTTRALDTFIKRCFKQFRTNQKRKNIELVKSQTLHLSDEENFAGQCGLGGNQTKKDEEQDIVSP